MARKARWEESPVENGISEVKLFAWKYFADYVRQEMLDYESYIWRGQRNSNWLLQPTLDRLIDIAKIAKTKRPNFRQEHLEQFKFAVRGRRGSNPAEIPDENEWWALGQHHGLATPLLDWTSSPFAAAYFAFVANGDPQSRYRAVYALNRLGVEKKCADIKKEAQEAYENYDAKGKHGLMMKELMKPSERREVEFIRPLSNENQRLVTQNGLFTRAPDGKNLDAWVKEKFAGDSRYYHFIKILIPNKDRHEALQMLNRMNINHLTLFPDLYGASKFCNLFGEVERY